MIDPVIIELEYPDFTAQAFRLDEVAGLTPIEGVTRETLLYSIYDLSDGHCSAEALFEKYADELNKAVWTMADSCGECDYWTAMYLWSNDDLDRLHGNQGISVSAGKWGRGFVQKRDESGTPRITREGGYVLACIPRGVHPAIEWRLLGHDPADHFYAAPIDSDSGRTLKQIFENPSAYPELIEHLSSSWQVLHDSYFEYTGFGPDGDHLSIAYSPAFTREHVQDVLQASYSIPYYKVRLSPAEYDLWLNGHHGFKVDLSKRVSVGKSV